MQLTVPPDLESLINKRLSTGDYASALEAQDAELSMTDEERQAMSAHIEEGYLQAEGGELIDSEPARQQIQAMKASWRLARQ